MGSQEHISIRAYARRRGVSDAAVRKWIKAGRIPTCADGKIDPELADAAVLANQSGGQPVRIALPEALVTAADPVSAAAAVGELLPLLLPPDGPTRADSERELAAIKAERARLALGRDRGEMVPVAEVEHRVGELIAASKSRLMLVPHKIADQLARTTDPAECRSILEHAIRESLEELSRLEVGGEVAA